MHDRDYGRLARVGVVTPQSNPTVEPEMGLLLPEGVSLLATRCTSRAEPRQRFLDYFDRLQDALESFDGMTLEAAAFACTASSYLLEVGHEQRHCERLQQRFGYPVITAAAAIEEALRHLGAERIALACPYPGWLRDTAREYWQARGFEVTAAVSAQPDMRDTRAIYRIRAAEAGPGILAALGTVAADVVVITGTGMPGLQLVCDLQSATGLPAVNSNLCLAWRCLRAAGVEPGSRAPEPGFPLLGGWRERVRTL